MESGAMRQIRVLQVCVVLLLIVTAGLCVNLFRPLVAKQKVKELVAEKK
ncbi:MAG: hypothetical protein NVS9B14_20790 [Candidatus Acidiferrum sp.]